MKLIIQLLAVMSLLSTVLSYKILCIFSVPSRSHNLLGKGIVDSLLKAGHEVTWATPYPDSKQVKNLKQLDLSVTVSLTNGLDMTKRSNDLNFVRVFAKNITTLTANCPELRHEVIHTQFDAVITEWFFSDTDAGYAAVQQVPWILLNGMSMHSYMELLVDEVRSLSTVPFMMNNFPTPMNFWQRVVNTVIFVMTMMPEWTGSSGNTERYHEFFTSLAAARGVPLPPFKTALYNISIMLVNSHPTISPALSLPPNVVDIAGYHINPDTAPLPKDIQELLDSSSQGVVYFSMGSVLKSAALPEKTRRDLIKILGEIPYTVLWKFEEELTGLPKNVHIRPWWPQPSILAHRNVKLFITHGGQLSSLEAIHNGVPLLAIPVFGDQPSNANRAERLGFARKVPYSPDMGPELGVVLKEMLADDRYYNQAKYLSRLFNNRPVSPQKLVAHYVEVAIETKGAYHLRSKTHLYPWYQRWMLDQLAALLVILYLLQAAVKALVRRCWGQGKSKVKKN